VLLNLGLALARGRFDEAERRSKSAGAGAVSQRSGRLRLAALADGCCAEATRGAPSDDWRKPSTWETSPPVRRSRSRRDRAAEGDDSGARCARRARFRATERAI
jgi:hypothetical protein